MYNYFFTGASRLINRILRANTSIYLKSDEFIRKFDDFRVALKINLTDYFTRIYRGVFHERFFIKCAKLFGKSFCFLVSNSWVARIMSTWPHLQMSAVIF